MKNSIEEDIKILEVENYYLEELGYLRENNHFIKFNQALKNLIKAYKELEESNQEKVKMLTEQNRNLQISYDSLQELFELRKYKNNSIPVSLVEEKIEELKQERTLKYDNYMGYKIESREQQYIDKKVQVLQELLEKRK